MTRHLKREVLPQLKLPVYDIVRVDETGLIKAVLQAESLLGIDPDNFDPHDVKIMGHIAAVRHQMGVAIAPQVADYVDMLIDGGETKLVVFGWHHDVIDLLEQRLGKYGVLRIDGRTSHEEREARKVMFIQGQPQVLIGNMQAMGVGLDGLQHVASHALIAEPDWVPSNNVQAIDRLDRFGQARTVLADLFVAPGSILEKILASALNKAHNIHRALDRSI
jgi:SNF2 family DNA or RNA helicase